MGSESQHLIHSLTAHLALYHSHISNRNTNPNPNPTHRVSVLRWFSSLSPAQRQAALTIFDSSFLLILLQMQSHLHRQGHSQFLLLPDLPSPSPLNPCLPSLSSRPSRGLISRSAASNSSALLLSNSLRFFSSTSSGVVLADALTVSESLVTDVDRFVGVMDGISGGRFLCEEVEVLGLTVQWMEFSWLKDMGYYSFEAFVVNRLEVALRLAWISSQGGKKPKEKRMKERATEVSGKAANVFWRMKCCLDWWVGLDPRTRRATISAFFGKTSKTLANEIIKEENAALSNGFGYLNIGRNLEFQYGDLPSWKKAKQALFESDVELGLDFLPIATSRVPNNLAIILNKLLVVHAMSNVLLAWQLGKVETEKLFFGSLGSSLTVSEYISRKLQRFLIDFHSIFINHELMEDTKLSSFPEKAEEKYNLVCGKGKSKSHSSKKSNAMPKAYNSASISRESSMRLDCSSELCFQGSTSSLVARRNIDGVVSHAVNNAPEVKPLAAQEEMDNLNARVSVDDKEKSGKRKSRRKGAKNKSSNVKNTGKSKHKDSKGTKLSLDAERELTGTIGHVCSSNSRLKADDISSCDNLLEKSVSDISQEYAMVDVMQSEKGIQEDQSLCLTEGRSTTVEECHHSSGKTGSDMLAYVSPCLAKSEEPLQTTYRNSAYPDKQNDPLMGTACGSSLRACEHDNVVAEEKHVQKFSCAARGTASYVSKECYRTAADKQCSVIHNGGSEFHSFRDTNFMGGASYEWPSITPIHFSSINSHLLPATDRLHLDVGVRLPYHNHQSFMASKVHVRNSLNEFGHNRILPSLTFPMSYDWPPMVKNCSRLSQTQTVGYESAYSHSMPPSLYTCAAHGGQANVAPGDNDFKHAGDIIDVYDMKNISDLVEDESYWLSEDESESFARSGRDYNNYFGGGVMYWNPAEFVGTGFSRPPSHSSEDGSWAWHEADLNRTIDDMVGCKTGLPTYSTNGMASPPSSSYCSPFEPVASGRPSMGYSVAGNDSSSNALHSPSVSEPPDEKISSSSANSIAGIEGVKGDPPPYPMLRPIIIPAMSRKGSRSEFKLGHDNKSACLPSTRRDTPLTKRPPSPVVLCVPRVTQPSPPSVGESRKRGFPIVRSGSSSPRHWGVKGWCHEESTVADPRLCLDGAEVLWPTWANKGLGVAAVAQSLQGSLLQDHLITISQLAHDQEHPDVALPLQPPDLLNGSCKGSLARMQNLLHEEIDLFCKQVAAENSIRKPFINWAVKRITRSLQVLWPRSRTNIFGSNSTGLALPTSDVDLVVSLPPVRNLEPIKEAGILEGRNGIKETCLQHAARYLANQEWVRNDSLKTIENTTIPVIMLVAEVPCDITLPHGSSSIADLSEVKSSKIFGHHNSASSKDSMITKDDAVVGVKPIRLDISFKSTSHTGLQTSELVRKLTQQFPASVPLALVLKKFLADRSLDHSYSGGLSSYCLVLLITRFLQHEHHCGYYMKQNLGSLLMEFLYFFGNVFDPRQMGISIQGSGVYMKRERGLSIDPIHIDDPLIPTNNVGRNCFRIHQCIKAFADAYTALESELSLFSDEYIPSSAPSFRLLRKIVPSID
ncbi:uncharacterized protein LOC110108337 [Dendrobium catenatum]|uniref:uncharacterized protein LOC110108337 n=1 Tax=Dendrobium catenatum TaxID=906689 RepID=UPI0009F62619|nr:uncharacterized protein LOC110108337 [Dendrobium catenatum]